jgi:hypothetical protein
MSFEDGQHLDAIPDHAVHDAVRAQEHLSDVLPVDLWYAAPRLGSRGCLVRSLPKTIDPLPCRTRVILGDIAADGA